MDFYYKNSNNVVIDLSKPPFYGMLSNTLLNYKWKYITQGQASQKIVKFEKEMVEKTFNIVISGSTQKEYLGNIDKFLQRIDVDIDSLKMGRLYIGKYYLDCYIFANTKSTKYIGTNMSKMQLSIVCENGNWQSEEVFSYVVADSEGGDNTGTGIDYPYDYAYDNSAFFDKNSIINESYMATDFELTFYGAASNPEVTIGGNIYRLYVELDANDYVKINSKTKKITLFRENGTQENVFFKRDRDNYIFQKIAAGGNIVLWDSNLKFDIRLFYERSEPKWSAIKWT